MATNKRVGTRHNHHVNTILSTVNLQKPMHCTNQAFQFVVCQIPNPSEGMLSATFLIFSFRNSSYSHY
jgi:hypothetical protein